MRAWLCYDLRTIKGGASSAYMTAAAIEQVAWADDKGFEAVVLPEHHASDDGYITSPFVLGGAMAARTSRLKLVVGAILMPLHNPLRVAEDAVVLDVISGERVIVAPGLGYNPAEFEMFGVSLRDRVKLVEEGIEVLRNAFTGEPFEYRGREARVTPRSRAGGGPPIYVCGFVAASARRAARLGDGFFPGAADVCSIYLEECERLGKTPGDVTPMVSPMFVHVAEDPEKAWAQIAPHALYEMKMYGQIAADPTTLTADLTPYQEIADVEAARASGVYAVVTPEQCIDLVHANEKAGLLVNFKPMMGGLSPDLAWESLELFANRVVPALGPNSLPS
jgi:alkanesulfonate monooxygenase SsuD/methylene tetrahydromethanopterin reductase-like flavin-dependent oxidoreductase (luciferase family)